jgi:hypothetical protein
MLGIALDLLPHAADVHVYRARIAVLGVPPDPLEELLARVDASGIGRERGEDLELDVGEANTTVPDHHTPAVEIDPERPGDDRLAGGRAGPEHVGAGQRGLHAAAKLAHGEAVERLAPITRRNHLVALLPQGVGEQLLDRMLVVHEQDASRSLGHGTRVFGPS